MTLAFQRQKRQQIVDRILNVSAMVGGFTIRDPPQTQHRHHVIDAQRAAVLHISAQQVDKRLIGAGGNDMRIHRRQAPVLAQRAQNIRRRAHGRFQAVQLTVAPGLRPAFGDAHRQIAVEANRHPVALAGFPAGGELAPGQPLQPEIETDVVLMLNAEGFHLRAVDILKGLRPGRPAPAQRVLLYLPGVKRIESGLPVEAFPFAQNKLAERCHLLIFTTRELFPRHTQRGHFQRSDGGIIHIVRFPRRLQCLLRCRRLPPRLRLFATLEIFNRVDVDINNVQPAT